MRIGVYIPSSDQQAAVDNARVAEASGFDYVAAGEHVFFHGSPWNGFVALAAAGGATERIRLLSALTIVPAYPPALLAKLGATLDQVSRGRFELGVGVGGEYPPEFEALGVPVRERGARADEALELLTRLWHGGPVEMPGHFTRIPGLELDPLPVQRPHPPIWVGGRKPAAIRRAGRFADVWLPYLYTPEQLESSLARVRAAAIDHGREPAAVRGAVHCWGAVDTDGRWARRQAIESVSATYRQDFAPLADRYLLTGTPARVVARLREFADAGAETVIFSPAGDGEVWRRLVDTFSTSVAPEIRGS